MALIKYRDLKSLQKAALQVKMRELSKDLIKLNAQRSTGTAPKNTAEIRNIRKTMARIQTIMHGGNA